MAELCDKSRCQVPREHFTAYQQMLFRIHHTDVTQECLHHNDKPDGIEKNVFGWEPTLLISHTGWMECLTSK